MRCTNHLDNILRENNILPMVREPISPTSLGGTREYHNIPNSSIGLYHNCYCYLENVPNNLERNHGILESPHG